MRAAEEEAKSVRERLHNTNKSYNTTLEELHAAERNLQQAKGEPEKGRRPPFLNFDTYCGFHGLRRRTLEGETKLNKIKGNMYSALL